MTVKQYQQLNKIPPTLTGIDLIYRKLSIMTGKSESYLERVPFKKINKLKEKLAEFENVPLKKRKTIWLNGMPFRLKDKPTDYDTNTYLSLKAFDKDRIEHMHQILAWIYKPLFKISPEKTYEWFLKADMATIQAAFFLFSRKSQKLKVHLECSIATSQKILTSHMKDLQNFVIQYKNTTAGITP